DGAATSASARHRRYCASLMNGPGGGCAPSSGSNGSGGVLALLSCDAAASAGIWRRPPPAAHVALGGSARAPPSPWLCHSSTSAHSACLSSPIGRSHNHRTAGYGPVCSVVWEGRSRETPPYPDSEHRFVPTTLRGA